MLHLKMYKNKLIVSKANSIASAKLCQHRKALQINMLKSTHAYSLAQISPGRVKRKPQKTTEFIQQKAQETKTNKTTQKNNSMSA